MILFNNGDYYPIDARKIKRFSRRDKLNPHVITIEFKNGELQMIPITKNDGDEKIKDIEGAASTMAWLEATIQKEIYQQQ